MVRIFGIDIPNKKSILISLTYIFGIGIKKSELILSKLNIQKNTKTERLNSSDISRIRNWVSKNMRIEGDLKKSIHVNIYRLINIRCYRGLRHKSGLPVHGQRTHSNAKNCKKMKARGF